MSEDSGQKDDKRQGCGPAPEERLIPPRGDYRTLLSFQKAEVVYDVTFRFAHKFLSRGDRTVDQMIQSARSGKKNIRLFVYFCGDKARLKKF